MAGSLLAVTYVSPPSHDLHGRGPRAARGPWAERSGRGRARGLGRRRGSSSSPPAVALSSRAVAGRRSAEVVIVGTGQGRAKNLAAPGRGPLPTPPSSRRESLSHARDAQPSVGLPLILDPTAVVEASRDVVQAATEAVGGRHGLRSSTWTKARSGSQRHRPLGSPPTISTLIVRGHASQGSAPLELDLSRGHGRAGRPTHAGSIRSGARVGTEVGHVDPDRPSALGRGPGREDPEQVRPLQLLLGHVEGVLPLGAALGGGHGVPHPGAG